ncbi:MAG: winged helix-turn-helix transcriptional regulator [Candidatus Thorarchaeota archaeon]|nr:winged helix-turn-helix transcriptional regulator [Candidatus Thorarchaeota archaeon]
MLHFGNRVFSRMSPSSKKRSVSIRLRLEPDLLERIDKLAGERGRQHFIEESVLWRLDQELPPFIMELIEDVNELKERVAHLENIQSTSVFLDELNTVAKTQICRDQLDRSILEYFLKNDGATTPELAKDLSSNRRTILDRIAKLNERAKNLIGVEVLKYEKGFSKGKRGAWWLEHHSKIVS